MLDLYKKLLAKQYDATLCMLSACIDRCPDDRWNEPVVELKFCQAVFHALFFTDAYLGEDFESQREQQFHVDHAEIFADYEELGGGLQQALYQKDFIRKYLQFCRDKASEVLAAETEESLAKEVGFRRQGVSRAEFYLIVIRHLHHHAAQLSLCLKGEGGEGVPWADSNWRDL